MFMGRVGLTPLTLTPLMNFCYLQAAAGVAHLQRPLQRRTVLVGVCQRILNIAATDELCAQRRLLSRDGLQRNLPGNPPSRFLSGDDQVSGGAVGPGDTLKVLEIGENIQLE